METVKKIKVSDLPRPKELIDISKLAELVNDYNAWVKNPKSNALDEPALVFEGTAISTTRQAIKTLAKSLPEIRNKGGIPVNLTARSQGDKKTYAFFTATPVKVK